MAATLAVRVLLMAATQSSRLTCCDLQGWLEPSRCGTTTPLFRRLLRHRQEQIHLAIASVEKMVVRLLQQE